ncbi:hypothetical protein AK812_SmicGene4646 [Symbiodinium microadriaticum]|uniref:Uncharacterized protein n=1 Tax=Symbiodinium microadriaticum TaxID=2951 RepID=A0A1Q9EVX9_SYMMI|nr:hypothetical protein AK812_SmicGene4646 [Symbiodinium microadriaticum]
MGKGTPLTSTMVSRAVYELLEYGDSVSLRELRLVLQGRTCIGLTSQKSFIRQVAEYTFATLTSGLDLMHLPLEQVARLRDPYVGRWEPLCNTVATGAASAVVPCMTRGSVLFTELHDLGSAIAIGAPSTFIHAGTDKLPKANDSLARNTCCHFRLSSESLGQHAHERRRTVLDYNSYNKMQTKPLDKTVDGGDGIAAGIAAIAQDVVQGRTIRTEVVDSMIDRGLVGYISFAQP